MIKWNKREIKSPAVESIFAAADKGRGISLFSSGCGDDREYTGINPVIILTEMELVEGKERRRISDPVKELDRLVESCSDLPGETALLGYISYDYKDRFEEPGLFKKRIQGIYPDFYFALFEHYILTDRNRSKGELFTLEFPFAYESLPAEDLAESLSYEILQKDKTENGSGRGTRYKGTSLDRKSFENAVGKTVDYIRQGDIYQANITRAIYGETEQEPLELAMKLYGSNRITYGVFASIPGGQVISTSPELFFRTEKGMITASPIKGTIARGSNPAEDESNRKELLRSEKNRAELAMIVDLLRNDLSRVCRPGTVKVPQFPVLMTLENVYHLYADVIGELNPGTGIGEILKKTFPGGSITGCPKIRACQIIDELEPVPRGIYTGSFGRIGFRGDSVFNIMIRSLFRRGSEVIYNVGGGITLLSEPEDEFEETVHKGRNIRQALKMNE
ncbi:MAG: anthranilate synthase component I family protein [Spirochaetales bacterium]|nr:anthranilate synthase component I family protein [Spirochaetales bacterium]